jgi:hypothetical protein
MTVPLSIELSEAVEWGAHMCRVFFGGSKWSCVWLSGSERAQERGGGRIVRMPRRAARFGNTKERGENGGHF